MKITLATLPEATAQQIFDQVATHLLTQMERSADKEGNCTYRGAFSEGTPLMCAAGCLIADEEYRPDMDGDGTSWGNLAREGLVPNNHSLLINSLQVIHDNYDPEDWFVQLTQFSSANDLNKDVLLHFANM
ncbi:MAG: hypothetical protein ACOH2T_18985 [Pseudomonas sp.]